jgi:xanthine dehydrogenase small subunit
MTNPAIEFVHRGQVVSLRNVPPSRTLLELLREDLQLSATKEGCGEGDCGACTVVLGQARDGRIHYQAVNACIRLAHSIHGMALWTARDLVAEDGSLHPVQQAMVQCHGSQCGFCTPGFVMSLFGLYQNQVCRGQPVTREAAQQALSGNLCRCTGYRPILQAAQSMAELAPVHQDEARVLQQLARIGQRQSDPEPGASYLAPRTLAQLLALRAQHPKAQLVAGCTDVGLWVTKQHREFAQVLDLSRVQELQRIEHYPHHLAIGAAVTLTDAFDTLVQQRPQLRSFASRFAGLPVRNAGTLGGNVANGSPIGDSMPLLIALGANVVLMSQRGHRELPLEQLYTGYRRTVLAADEVLAWIKVPSPTDDELSRVYKISKRFEDDISAVCLAIRLRLQDGLVREASIGVGGVAATPVRAVRTQAALLGLRWSQQAAQAAAAALRGEFAPISDMRASAAYRSEVLGNLLQRFWMESQGQPAASLQSLDLEALPS